MRDAGTAASLVSCRDLESMEFVKRLPLLLLLLFAGLLGAAAGSAFAVSSASVANLTLPAVVYSHVAQSSSGTMTLTATNDATTGFSVTILASNFVYSGVNAGSPIPAANFSITSAATPVMTAGQAVDATNGPKVPAVSPVGTLDGARKTVQANAGFGVGTYTQALAVTLSVPGQARAGTYTSTLTTTISAAP